MRIASNAIARPHSAQSATPRIRPTPSSATGNQIAGAGRRQGRCLAGTAAFVSTAGTELLPTITATLKIARRARFGKPACVYAWSGRAERLPSPDLLLRNPEHRELQRPPPLVTRDPACKSGSVPLTFLAGVGCACLVSRPRGTEHAQQSIGNFLVEHLIPKLAQGVVQLRVAVGCRPLVFGLLLFGQARISRG